MIIWDFIAGRYETGNENNKVVVKKNKSPYVNVKWGNSMTDLTGGAVELSKKFTDDKLYKGKVTSTLIYGIQWEQTINFCYSETELKLGRGKGWFSDNSGGASHKTGEDVQSVCRNKAKNIYDLAGNVEEWTMEAVKSVGHGASFVYRARRGDYYSDNGNGSSYSASFRSSAYPTVCKAYCGFRIILYL